jgi:hypothetical protein
VISRVPWRNRSEAEHAGCEGLGEEGILRSGVIITS